MFDAQGSISMSVGWSGYLQKNLAAALRMRDCFLDGRKGVGRRYRNVHLPRRYRIGGLPYRRQSFGR
jgi:hypothetical protein